jgi:hypothetical protein
MIMNFTSDLKEFETATALKDTNIIQQKIDQLIYHYKNNYLELIELTQYFCIRHYSQGTVSALNELLRHPMLKDDDLERIALLLDEWGYTQISLELFLKHLSHKEETDDVKIIKTDLLSDSKSRIAALEKIRVENWPKLSSASRIRLLIRLLRNLALEEQDQAFYSTALRLFEMAPQDDRSFAMLAVGELLCKNREFFRHLKSGLEFDSQLHPETKRIFDNITTFHPFSFNPSEQVDDYRTKIKNYVKACEDWITEEDQSNSSLLIKQITDKKLYRENEQYSLDYDKRTWEDYQKYFTEADTDPWKRVYHLISQIIPDKNQGSDIQALPYIGIHKGVRSNVIYRSLISKKVASRLLTTLNTPQKFINWGSSYAWLESELSKEFPECLFYGLDRFECNRNLNRKEFKSKNLFFISTGDMLDFIKGNQKLFKDSAFHHCYTAMFFLPAFIEQLYSKLFLSGASYIICHEHTAYSNQLKQIYRISETEHRESALHRDSLILHNYPSILSKAGFKMVSAESYRSALLEDNFNSLVLIAKRKI